MHRLPSSRLSRISQGLFSRTTLLYAIVYAVAAGRLMAAPSSTVVISQIYGGGGNAGAPWSHDFVELHNVSNIPQDITGWSIQYASATSSSWAVTPLSGTIPAGGYFLIQQASNNTSVGAPLPTPETSGTQNMAASAGKVALLSTATALSGATPTNPAIVDFVGYGSTSSASETAPAPAPGATTSIIRDADSTDTDNNSADFSSRAPAPRNGATPPHVPSAGPDTIAPAIVSLSPSTGSLGIATDPALVIRFSEAIAKGAGNLSIHRASDGSSATSTSVSSSAVAISGGTATWTPETSLLENTSYHVRIDPGAFVDLAGNPFSGITDSTTWIFTTSGPDVAAPEVIALAPAHGSVAPATLSQLRIRFNEPVAIAGGEAWIRRSGDGALIETVDLLEDAFVENRPDVHLYEATLALRESLDPGAAYHVTVGAGAFEDAAGNASAAIGGPSAWSFSTAAVPGLGAEDPYSEDFTGFQSAETLPQGWSVSGPLTTYGGTWGVGSTVGLRGNASVLGYQHTGSTGLFQKILTLQNHTGAELTSIVVSYRGRAARLSDPAAERSPAYVVTVAGVEVPALAYSTADGDNLPRSATVSDLSVEPGGLFQIVWTSDRGLPANASKQIGLSAVSVSSGAGLFPPTLAGPVVHPAGLTSVTAAVSAEVIGDGGATITGRGFVLAPSGTNPSPVAGGPGVTVIASSSAEHGTMEAIFSDLQPSTTYSVRAFATNAQGTTYTETATFTTLPPPPLFTGTYSQPFNHFSGTLPAGWSAVSSGGIHGYAGTWTSTSTTGGLYGGTGQPGVLGYQHNGNSGDLTVALTLTNGTGSILNELHISYLGSVERLANPRFPGWTVSIDGVEIPALAYSTSSGADELKSLLLTGLEIAPGATFTLTWKSDRGENTTGTSRRIGLANVVVSTQSPGTGGGFEAWAAAKGIAGHPADGDFDGDGLANLIEYALGLDPAKANGFPGTFDGRTLGFRKGAEASANGDVILAIEVSPDLTPGSWTKVTPATEDATGISYTLPAGQARWFARLVVTQVPANETPS
jgi:hypothetical protein